MSRSDPVNVPEGWKLVPIFATPEMLAAALNEYGDGHGFSDAYTTMVLAAPIPPVTGEDDETLYLHFP